MYRLGQTYKTPGSREAGFPRPLGCCSRCAAYLWIGLTIGPVVAKSVPTTPVLKPRRGSVTTRAGIVFPLSENPLPTSWSPVPPECLTWLVLTTNAQPTVSQGVPPPPLL